MVKDTITLNKVKYTLFRHLTHLVGKPSEKKKDLDMYSQVADHIHANLYTSKGLAIRGYLGNGKTTLITAAIRTIKELMDGVYDHPPCRMIHASDLNDLFPKNPEMEQYRAYLALHKHLVIDDIGTEDPYTTWKVENAYHFKGLIYAAYDMPNAPAIHFTSNLGKEQFSALYGERVLDRTREMNTHLFYNVQQSKRHARQREDS